MPLELHELSGDAEFPALVDGLWRGYDQPFNGFWEILKGPSKEECIARYQSWHKADPTSHWLYVTDSETNQVAGAMQWNIFETNPYINGPPSLPAYWWPEGTLKEIADQLFAGFFSGRPSRFGRPHLLISYCFTDPNYRHRGVASLAMKWGLKKCDELGLDAFVESTEDGRGFYEAHGFEVFDDFTLDASTNSPSEEFTQQKVALQLPLHGYYMKRPFVAKLSST
ncbi:hypothetical protein UA08_06902 [Talaromyces atroroseus]|uniref:N-acetyltransferase domain-containing protein n=1 Tax=Talaromyces atroroseus TaxID=1441469 RepID=A0A225AKG0_TALAT|nr:hypothetical protein UA08_06902 [Talaromyces atroroseus]OKL57708.1 hypothetical protein UA08_06902 [Talaromyces atroroseus]